MIGGGQDGFRVCLVSVEKMEIEGKIWPLVFSFRFECN